ncbi:MAG: ABC transporter ATP-binding protein [bacterium]|nr:ABC transporter ATP-binding protein [bacterium]
MALLDVVDLAVSYPVRRGVLAGAVAEASAVDGVSFSVARGETLGLVGESGCGKTTVAKAVLRLIQAARGRVLFDGRPVLDMAGGELRRLRRRMQIVFQDPISSLNPRMTAGGIVGEPLRVHRIARGRALRAAVGDLLRKVGLPAAAADRYPHEFSGGQRQRIGIARAIALSPDLLVCDEPVSSLDISIQAQIINLLEEIQGEMGLSVIFISHDLRVVEHVSERVAVMYLGKFVEVAGRDALYREPLHPYTTALLDAVLEVGRGAPASPGGIRGEIASALAPPAGCRFHPRCPYRMPVCPEAEPPLSEAAPGHRVACFLYP